MSIFRLFRKSQKTEKTKCSSKKIDVLHTREKWCCLGLSGGN